MISQPICQRTIYCEHKVKAFFTEEGRLVWGDI